jgi:hypothetical protein
MDFYFSGICLLGKGRGKGIHLQLAVAAVVVVVVVVMATDGTPIYCGDLTLPIFTKSNIRDTRAL